MGDVFTVFVVPPWDEFFTLLEVAIRVSGGQEGVSGAPPFSRTIFGGPRLSRVSSKFDALGGELPNFGKPCPSAALSGSGVRFTVCVMACCRVLSDLFFGCKQWFFVRRGTGHNVCRSLYGVGERVRGWGYFGGVIGQQWGYLVRARCYERQWVVGRQGDEVGCMVV